MKITQDPTAIGTDKHAAVKDMRAKLLLLIAEEALFVLKSGIDDRRNASFKNVLENARINNVISDAMIAELGATSRSNASRWMHAETYPHIHVQERVLLGIAKIADHRCRNIINDLPEEQDLVIAKIIQSSSAFPDQADQFER